MQTPPHVVIRVYNEAENFLLLRSPCPSPFEAFVVYDFDLNNTIPRSSARSEKAIGGSISSRTQSGREWLAQGKPASSSSRGAVLVVMGDVSDDLDKESRWSACTCFARNSVSCRPCRVPSLSKAQQVEKNSHNLE
jgi:hypothetical protein